VKCPHRLTDFHEEHTDMGLVWRQADQCGRVIISLLEQKWLTTTSRGYYGPEVERQVWPKGVARAPLPAEVPEKYANDYREPCLISADSPKASAALSRRCLTPIAQAIDAIRHIGNTGEIMDVEPGEAEWSLDVLEALFDHYFVQPTVLAAKKAALNQKLADGWQAADEVDSCSSKFPCARRPSGNWISDLQRSARKYCGGGISAAPAYESSRGAGKGGGPEVPWYNDRPGATRP